MSPRNAEEAAWAELDRLTDGSPGKLWRWSIPANPERDSDLILAAGLKAVADERDTALAALEEAERNNADLLLTLTKLKPADVLVEGTYFPVNDLPTILGNFMRSDIEWSREAKRAHLREEGLAAERDAAEWDWADYFESFDSTVGAPTLTPALAASLMRGPRPFGAMAGGAK